MSFPFGNYCGNMIVDDNADPNTVYLFNPKYKDVPVGTGEPLRMKEVIDWEATAKASAVVVNIGEAG
jgi:uncharacterized protein (DUF3820 family)